VLNAPVVCAYIWWYFYQLRTHNKLRKCVKESKQYQELLSHTNEDLQQDDAVPTSISNCNEQLCYDDEEKNRYL